MAGSKVRESWSSRFGFIMATAGFAVGLGNIWRFPYLTGMNGGGAFLFVYLVFALLIGIPLMVAEVGLGRRAQRTPIAGMEAVTGSRTNPWNIVGWMGVTAALLIQSYYLMLMGWIVGYFVMIVSGGLEGATPGSLNETYVAFTTTPGPVIFYTLVVLVVLTLLVRRGLASGLERAATTAMPALIVLLVVLAIRSMTFPGAWEGLVWYLTPDFSAINGRVVLQALGQAFYSIGIGMAGAFGFGSYLNRTRDDVPGNCAIVVVADTVVAVLAGLVIFPALFAFGLQPDAGPGLLFVTMTTLFTQMPAGTLFGAAFFFLLILAALTSGVALQEVLTASITDLAPIRRRHAAALLAAGLFVTSTLVTLSVGPWTWLRISGMDLFAWADLVSGSYLLPAGGLALSLYVLFGWGFDRFRDDINAGAGSFRVNWLWRPLMMFIIPPAVLIVLLAGLGLI